MIKNLRAYFALDAQVKTNPFLHRRIIMTAALLVVTTVTFAIFFVINFDTVNYVLPLVNIIFSISAAIALYTLIVKNSFNFSAYFATMLLFSFLIFFTYFARNESFGLVWTLCYPLFVIPILGIRKGIIMVAIFYSMIVPMAFLGIGEWDYGFWDIKGFVRFIIASGLVVYTTCFLNYQHIQHMRRFKK